MGSNLRQSKSFKHASRRAAAPPSKLQTKASGSTFLAAASLGAKAGLKHCSPVVWEGVIYDPSGYADEARGFIMGLRRMGLNLAVRQMDRVSPEFRDRLDPKLKADLDYAIGLKSSAHPIVVRHAPGYSLERLPGAAYTLSRTMFETDRLPPNWVSNCNRIDEVWVPAAFNAQTFLASGVKTRIVTIPGGIDAEHFRPGLEPLSIPDARGTVFLGIFEWSYRKGWDVLLRAWAAAFDRHDGVSLLLRTYPINKTDAKDNETWINRRINEFLQNSLGLHRADIAPIIVLGEQVPEADLPRLFASASAYVTPSRGEGWGRPYLQAMACALPTIGTNWGGNTEFMTPDNSLLLDIDGLAEIDERSEVAYFRGHRWAEPSVNHLAELMRRVHERPEEAAEIGRRARQDVESRWTWEQACRLAAERLQDIAGSLGRTLSIPEPNQAMACSSPSDAVITVDGDGVQPAWFSASLLPIRWEGSQFVHHSLALVNRELCSRLIATGHEISIVPYGPDQFGPGRDPNLQSLADRTNAALSGPAAVHIRHQWPPRFDPPPEGHWVMIQPWEFGSVPAEWIGPMTNQVDEVWAYTNFVRDCYIRSGVPEDRVHVVPLGVDCNRFSPQARPLPLKTRKRFKLLFVGGTIWRKGIDVLLSAYTRAFTAADDICLVVKDIGGSSFYRGQTAESLIEKLRSAPDAPEIEYIDTMLSDAELPGLYTACDCLVHPYRGEGFGLPIAEAMACGLPVVVTNYGAALDFCSDESAYLIPAQEAYDERAMVNDMRLVGPIFWGEPDVQALTLILRKVYDHPEEAIERGQAGRDRILAGFTWDQSLNVVESRISAVASRPIRRHSTGLKTRKTPPGTNPDTNSQASARNVVGNTEPSSPQDNARSQEAAERAVTAEAAGDLETALAGYLEAAELMPKEANLAFAAGRLALSTGRPKAATKWLGRAAELAPNVALNHGMLGLAQQAKESFFEAALSFAQAVQLEPKNALYMRGLAQIYQSLGDFSGAVHVYQRLLSSPEATIEDLLAMGEACRQGGSLVEARVAFELALEFDPECEEARAALAELPANMLEGATV